MSTKIMGPCWDLQLPTQPKIVLISLADQANDEGLCWPSVATIGRRTGMKPRRIQHWLSWLEQHGYLRRKVRLGHSSLFDLTPAIHGTPVASNTPTPAIYGNNPRNLRHPHPRNPRHPEPSFEPLKNHARAREEENKGNPEKQTLKAKDAIDAIAGMLAKAKKLDKG